MHALFAKASGTNLMKPRHVATRVLRVSELADYLRVHPSTIFRLLKRKELPAFKVGGDWRFNVEQIDRWRAEREIRVPRHRN
jgi:excisionase family DNA binding protein